MRSPSRPLAHGPWHPIFLHFVTQPDRLTCNGVLVIGSDPFPMKSSMRLAAQHDDSADRLRTIEQRLKLLETTIVRRHNM